MRNLASSAGDPAHHESAGGAQSADQEKGKQAVDHLGRDTMNILTRPSTQTLAGICLSGLFVLIIYFVNFLVLLERRCHLRQ